MSNQPNHRLFRVIVVTCLLIIISLLVIINDKLGSDTSPLPPVTIQKA